jgi:hypothetical protein
MWETVHTFSRGRWGGGYYGRGRSFRGTGRRPGGVVLVVARHRRAGDSTGRDGAAKVGGPSLQFRDATNPEAEPIFVLSDKDEVHRWEYLEGVRQHLDRLLRVASGAVRSMGDATEVCLTRRLSL